MHRSTILSRPHKSLVLPRNRTNNPSQSTVQRISNIINTTLELVKSSPSRTIHLTRQRLRGIKQIPHQNTKIFRLRLRSLPQINQRVALHSELHNNPQFLEQLNSSSATLTQNPNNTQPPLKHQPNPHTADHPPKPTPTSNNTHHPQNPVSQKDDTPPFGRGSTTQTR